MQAHFFILVLCYNIQNAAANSPDSWSRSRYIIDNRRNALFSKKLLPSPAGLRYNEPLKEKFYPVERYHKDLSAEASIPEPKFFGKDTENSLPRKIVKSYKLAESLGDHEYNGMFESRGNATGLLDFIHNEEELLNEVVKVAPSTPKTHESRANLDLSTTRTIDHGNQIDEKHVYETRIETVSYHQEIIFPKKETWYQKQRSVGYEDREENNEQTEKNYEESETNDEESEKNYEMNERMSEEQKKFGYVVEGSNYRKYRVEERTVDGFIVGEYGVVSHDDGSLRGVRYTADGNTNPKLIYETLIKFLSL